MTPQPFLVIEPVTHPLYGDPIAMWDHLAHIWAVRLADSGGSRAPGPLLLRRMQLADIAGIELPEGVAAMFSITGPAIQEGQ